VPTITINIVDGGSPTSDGGSSTAGHMWFEYEGQSYGFAPDGVQYGDSAFYTEVDYSRTISISEADAANLESWLAGLSSNPAWQSNDYNVLTNSCVDFTWKALEEAGLNNQGFEGDLWPINNTDNIDGIDGYNGGGWGYYGGGGGGGYYGGGGGYYGGGGGYYGGGGGWGYYGGGYYGGWGGNYYLI